jgi:signal transduction histidine kinase
MQTSKTMKSITYKIAFGYFVIIFINVTVAIFAIYYLNRLSSPIEQSVEEKIKNVNAAESMVQSLVQLELVQYAMITGGYENGLQVEFHTYQNEFYNWHQRAIEGVSETMDIRTLDSILAHFNRYISYSEEIQNQLQSAYTPENLRSYHYKNIIPVLRKIESLCTQIIRVNRESIENARRQAEKMSDLAETIILIFSALAVLFSILASIYFTNKIVKPIKRTISTVKKIGQGQLKQKIFISSNDEIAELGQEFNKMTERLYEYEQMNIKQIITEKKKSEAIVSGMPVAILVTDNDLCLSLVNEPAQKLIHLTDNSWQGKKVSQIISDKALVKLLSGQEIADQKEFDPHKSIITLQSDNKSVYLLARQVKISDAGDDVSAIVTMLHDVTPFKELEDLKSEFIAIISHQIKTPLTSILMIVDILLKEIKGNLNEEQRDLLQDAKFDSQRLKDFVFDLLNFSRLETGKTKFEFTTLTSEDIEKIVEDVLIPFKPLLDEKQAVFTKEIDTSITSFNADSSHLSVVFSNIIENALIHITTGGKITFSATKQKRHIQFSISDNGAGIDEEKIPFIFDKFVQVKEFQNNEGGNIGLGLAIAKEIVTAHQGEIWVKSKLGEGTTFYIKIPIQVDH